MIRRLTRAESDRRIRELRKMGCKVKKVKTSEGTLVLKKCPPKKYTRKEAEKVIRALVRTRSRAWRGR